MTPDVPNFTCSLSFNNCLSHAFSCSPPKFVSSSASSTFHCFVTSFARDPELFLFSRCFLLLVPGHRPWLSPTFSALNVDQGSVKKSRTLCPNILKNLISHFFSYDCIKYNLFLYKGVTKFKNGMGRPSGVFSRCYPKSMFHHLCLV